MGVISEGVDVVLLIEDQGVVTATGYLQSLLFDTQVEQEWRRYSDRAQVLGRLSTLALLVTAP